MKYINLIIGVILFAGILSLLFNFMADVGGEYQDANTNTYTELQAEYGNYTTIGHKEDGALREVQEKLEGADATTLASAVGVVDAAVDGGKQIKQSIGLTSEVVDKVTEDTSEGGIGIPPVFGIIVKSIIAAAAAIIILQLFLKFKAET